MSEPSKWAVEAAEALWPIRQTTVRRVAREIQRFIDAATAEKDREIERLKAEVKGWSDANKAQSPVHIRVVTELQEAKQRIAKMAELLDELPHRIKCDVYPSQKAKC